MKLSSGMPAVNLKDSSVPRAAYIRLAPQETTQDTPFFSSVILTHIFLCDLL